MMQLPKLYEEDVVRLTHHSLQPAKSLAAAIASHWRSRFAVGETVEGTLPDGRSAACCIKTVVAPPASPKPDAGPHNDGDGGDARVGEAVLRADPSELTYEVAWLGDNGTPTGKTASLRLKDLRRRDGDGDGGPLTEKYVLEWLRVAASAEPVTGVAGVECLWRVSEYFRRQYDLPEALPAELAETLRPARHAAQAKAGRVASGVDDALQEAGLLEGEAVPDAGAMEEVRVC
jgi:hypothetical protein